MVVRCGMVGKRQGNSQMIDRRKHSVKHRAGSANGIKRSPLISPPPPPPPPRRHPDPKTENAAKAPVRHWEGTVT